MGQHFYDNKFKNLPVKHSYMAKDPSRFQESRQKLDESNSPQDGPQRSFKYIFSHILRCKKTENLTDQTCSKIFPAVIASTSQCVIISSSLNSADGMINVAAVVHFAVSRVLNVGILRPTEAYSGSENDDITTIL